MNNKHKLFQNLTIANVDITLWSKYTDHSAV